MWCVTVCVRVNPKSMCLFSNKVREGLEHPRHVRDTSQEDSVDLTPVPSRKSRKGGIKFRDKGFENGER